MKIIRALSTRPDQPATSPFPLTNGVLFEMRGGDIAEPLALKANWFSPPYPERVFRYFLRWPLLPYVAVKWGRFGFYAGAKIFGVDSDAYKEWLCPPEEVYDGSLALCFTIRFSTNR